MTLALNFGSPPSKETNVTPTFDYRLKFGPVCWLMGHTSMELMIGKIIDANLQGPAEKVSAG